MKRPPPAGLLRRRRRDRRPVSPTSEAWKTAFHAYATSARAKNKRYTLAVRCLKDSDTASSVLAEFLGILDGLGL
jgi:hypothetical protein